MQALGSPEDVSTHACPAAFERKNGRKVLDLGQAAAFVYVTP
jgi:hypothetical protein